MDTQRLVRLGRWGEAYPLDGRTMLTPNENAAKTLGVAPLSIETLARQVLGENLIAHPLLAQKLLRASVVEVLGSSDPDGVARSLSPSIRELFRSGVDTG